MGQLSFTEAEYPRRKRRTKKEDFLDSMDEIIPWKDWIALIEPCYYNNTKGRRSSLKQKVEIFGINWDKYIESCKSSVRSKVEHPFLIIKHKFGYSKVAYRGIAKNLNRLNVLFASVNLVMCIRAGQSSEFIRAYK